MKNIIIIWFCVFICIQSKAQTPNFIFSLQATNVLGHKDSMQIGTYDASVFPIYETPINGLDGPQLASQQGDSNMVMRVAYMNASNNYQTNKRIVPSRCQLPIFFSPMTYGNQVIIFLYAKKWPILLSWESTLFAKNLCVHKSFFSVTRYGTAYPDSINPETYSYPIVMAALRGRTRIYSTLSGFSNGSWLWNQNTIALNNGKQGKYYSISLYLNRKLGTEVSNRKAKKPYILSLYPNHATEQLVINRSDATSVPTELRILTIEDKSVYQQNLQSVDKQINIGVSRIKSGFYLVQLRYRDGSI